MGCVTPGERAAMAHDLFGSMRGRYIVSQALTLAIGRLEEVAEPFRESSNIEDMRLLQDELFPLFKGINRALEAAEELRRAKADARALEETGS